MSDSDDENDESKKGLPNLTALEKAAKKLINRRKQLAASLPILSEWHQTAVVEVNVEDLRSPPLFRYTVRRELNVL